ncbi:lysine-sensitive aspartokinase 3 [Candidatus Woesearchaeota archaeon]|nr:lysine-sensitive aspartokinase 3 [Candidatus Woesearchaeota archaeon]
MKFGGTSVGDADRIANVANIVKSNVKRNPVVVVSAVTKITDALIRLGKESAQGKGHETLEHIRKTHFEIIERLGMGKELLKEDLNELESLADQIRSSKGINEKTLDQIQSFGERMSSKIIASQLNKIGIKSQSFDSWQLGFLTNEEFGEAEPLDASYANLNKNIKKLDIVPVITGFIGKTEKGEITTLGRGGSDYTAAIIGAAAGADEIQIWTDVNGVMSTDPKIVANARTLEKVSFAEASELAYFGARVLHPKTILPAMKKNIPVKVLNSFNPENEGTVIVNMPYRDNNAVKAIAHKKNIALVNIDSTRMLGAYGFLARLFGIFDKYRKSIDVVSTSEVSVSLTIDSEENIGSILQELKEIADVELIRNKAIICIVGEGMRKTPGIAGRTFTALGKSKINVEMISQGASEINITFIVDSKDAEKAVRVLHEEYFGV